MVATQKYFAGFCLFVLFLSLSTDSFLVLQLNPIITLQNSCLAVLSHKCYSQRSCLLLCPAVGKAFLNTPLHRFLHFKLRSSHLLWKCMQRNSEAGIPRNITSCEIYFAYSTRLHLFLHDLWSPIIVSELKNWCGWMSGILPILWVTLRHF